MANSVDPDQGPLIYACNPAIMLEIQWLIMTFLTKIAIRNSTAFGLASNVQNILSYLKWMGKCTKCKACLVREENILRVAT